MMMIREEETPTSQPCDVVPSDSSMRANDSFPPIVDNSERPMLVLSDELADLRPAEERIESLFSGMPGSRGTLLAVLEACRAACSEEDLLEVVREAQRNNSSVYSSFELCRMLEKAGALFHVLQNGEPFESAPLEPVEGEEEGVPYLQASMPPASFWVCTPEGTAYLEADNPLQRTQDLFSGDEMYLPIYQQILLACLGGTSTVALAEAVDDHPLVQKPRLYVQHFLKLLEDAGALQWQGEWITTEAGAKVIGEVFCG